MVFLFNTKPDEGGKEWPQVVAILIGCLACITSGLLVAWTSPYMMIIIKDKENYDISEEEASYFTTIPPAVMMVACVISSKLSDMFGRKHVLALMAIPHILFWILTAVAKNVYVFYMARVCVGLGDGILYSVFPIYIGEVSVPRVRGSWGTAGTSSCYLGTLLMTTVGGFLNVKTCSYIFLPLPILFLALFIHMPESPYFLIMKGRYDDAKKSLKFLRKKQKIDDEFALIKTDIERQMLESETWKELFTVASNRRALIAGILLRSTQFLGGMLVFINYNQFIFQKYNTNPSPEMSSIIYMSLLFIFLVCAGFSVDKLGRRKSLIASLIPCSLVFALMALFSYVDQYHKHIDISDLSWVPLAGMILFVLFSSYGVGVVPGLMLGELFSTSVKANAIMIVMIFSSFSYFLASAIFYYLNVYIGMYASFLFFSCVNFVCAILSFHLIPETKGKTLEEIQQSLKNMK